MQRLEKRGYEIFQGIDSFSEPLLGGCLESLAGLLSGERYPEETEVNQTYNLFLSLKQWRGKILFLETSEEKPIPK